ncbi:MAG: dTMP kinase [Alphaproteobacteria bacterium]|nr:dTMP kinase [Alphaproteobacteria bacterium]
MSGKFITLEGGEGAGKSTLARALAERLEAAGVQTTLTREPGGSPGADAIRALFVRGDAEKFAPLTDALLIAAARADHIAHTIAPARAAGRWVICDRFTDSTHAYQGAGRGVDMAVLTTLDALIDAPKPDLTLVLDVDPKAGVRRSKGAHSGEDRFERMDLSFHQTVRAAFLGIARDEPDRCVVIDAALDKDAVRAAALDAIASRLGVHA